LIVIEQCTRGQSNNEVWLEQRKGRLTASILHEVSNTITKTTPLVAKVFGKSQSIDHVPAIQYGHANEPVKRTAFGFTLCREESKLEISASETDLWSSLLESYFILESKVKSTVSIHLHNNLMLYQYMGDKSRSFSCTYKKRGRRSELKI
jgi:hypothetical protein